MSWDLDGRSQAGGFLKTSHGGASCGAAEQDVFLLEAGLHFTVNTEVFVRGDASWCNMHTLTAVFVFANAEGGLLQQLNRPSGKTPEVRAAEPACLTHSLRLSCKRAFCRLDFMKGSPRGSVNVLSIHSECFISSSLLRGVSTGLTEITLAFSCVRTEYD